MGVGSKWIKLRKSYRDGSLKTKIRSMTGSYRDGRLSGEILSEGSNKERKEISDIVISINDYLQIPPTQESTSKSWKICRVPNNLREIHQHDFDPKLVSIGPLHRHRSHLKAMAEHKKRFLLRLLDSMDQTLEPEQSTADDKHQKGTIFGIEVPPIYSPHQNGTTLEPVLSQEQCEVIRNAKIESLVVAMKELEAIAKGYYLETFDKFGPNEFVMMMILDGCFVVELLRLYTNCEMYDKETDDPIFNTRWMLPNLQRDLLLFENQLPYLVLDKLFEITKSKADTCSLIELTLKFFDPVLPRELSLLNDCRVDVNRLNPDHLLGIFRSTFISSSNLARRSSSIKNSDSINPMNMSITIPHAIEDRQLIHCVTELKEAGVSFRRRDNYNLLDIEFKNGKLYIPPLSIDDHTCPVFLNFIAYEQCNINAEPYFTHYFLFFDSLVNSSKDVEHLHYKGIIDHILGSDEDVADLFNKLCKEVVHNVDDFYLSKTLKEVNQYFHMKRHKWWATWKHDYFSNPWAFSSFLAAIFLLLLTTIQSFFSVFAYFLPPS